MLGPSSHHRRVTQRFDEWLAPAGLRSTQFCSQLRARRGIGFALAEKLDTDRTTLTRNLQLLRDWRPCPSSLDRMRAVGQ
jgi:hypothetical protein